MLDEFVSDGRSAVLVATHVYVLSPIATALRQLVSDDWQEVGDLSRALVDRFGEPEELGAAALTRRALEDLAALDLIELRDS